MWIAGVLTVQRGQYTRGVRLIAAGAQFPLVRASLDPDERGDWDASLVTARTQLGQEDFDRAWADGQTMTLEQAIAFGLTRDQPVSASGAPKHVPLSSREQEVAMLIAQGCSNREIGTRLVISERTAEAHVTHVLSKLGLRSRAQVAIWALQSGLIGTRSA